MKGNEIWLGRSVRFLLFIFYFLFSICLKVNAQKAFPSAEGFGKYASGGRFGKVVEVTNLNDSGEGSLRWALTEAGRERATIVFRVTGVITLKSDIRAKLHHVTIAGQTAPGKGILYRGGKLNLGGSHNVIIRNLRGRIGLRDDKEFIKGGSIGIENADTIIIDHCCFGWSGEENMTVYDNHFTTVQWCIVHEGLYSAGHQKGNRSYGSQWGGSPATFHHNLLAHNYNRSPRINGASNANQDRNVFLEYINNVNYNWGKPNSCYGGENEAGPGSTHECNFIGNYYKPGPSTPQGSVFIQLSKARKGKTLTSPSLWYLSGNKMEGDKKATKKNWLAVDNQTGFALDSLKSEQPLKPSVFFPPFNIYRYADYATPAETADEAYERVLQKAGTIRRDKTELRIVDEVRQGTARYKGSLDKAGFIDSPADADGWPTYPYFPAAIDEDHDGMDDSWELLHSLDPGNPEDRNRILKGGYTALETYLNHLMGE
ncbi:MAG: pectate lyase [Prevotella sp.]|nr:pectate lyase [Prevotella sp.]